MTTTATRRPYSASTKFADKKVAVTDPEAALQEQLQDDRYTEMRADVGQQYIENLAIPNYGDHWVPGYKVIPVGPPRSKRAIRSRRSTSTSRRRSP
jgi:hypothetical protein